MPQQWPTAGDYAQALQNPHVCFRDPQMQAGRVKKHLMGMPVGSDGNAAIVFELSCPTNTFAIKCFKRAATDRQQHYNELSQQLRHLSSPYLTDFSYLPDTILIKGEWFPLLRMAWVSPNQLGYHIEQSIAQGKSLSSLANAFRSMMREIGQLNIVHGDLQHGNVLVEPGGQLRLIDYDGTCVLPWRGTLPDERGHPNYQHPERLRSGYYEANTDAFAAQVIYLSLLALEVEPSLWSDFNNAENLLFTAKDFGNPSRTKIWSRLLLSPNTEVRRLTAKLDEACRAPIATIASLESLLTSSSPSVTSPPSNASPATTATHNPSTAPTGGTGASTLPVAPVWVTHSAGATTTAIPGALSKEGWDDNSSRRLRWILISITVLAVLVGAGIIIWLKQVLSTQQSASTTRPLTQTIHR